MILDVQHLKVELGKQVLRPRRYEPGHRNLKRLRQHLLDGKTDSIDVHRIGLNAARGLRPHRSDHSLTTELVPLAIESEVDLVHALRPYVLVTVCTVAHLVHIVKAKCCRPGWRRTDRLATLDIWPGLIKV